MTFSQRLRQQMPGRLQTARRPSARTATQTTASQRLPHPMAQRRRRSWVEMHRPNISMAARRRRRKQGKAERKAEKARRAVVPARPRPGARR